MALPEFSVIISPLAKRDIESIGDYLITEAGHRVADRIISGIDERIASLVSLPHRGQSAIHIRPLLRRLIYESWIIYYRIVISGENNGDQVQIVRVLHHAQDHKEAL